MEEFRVHTQFISDSSFVPPMMESANGLFLWKKTTHNTQIHHNKVSFQLSTLSGCRLPDFAQHLVKPGNVFKFQVRLENVRFNLQKIKQAGWSRVGGGLAGEGGDHPRLHQ